MKRIAPARQHYDFVIIGSGFGGSVSAYRLSQKGYKVLVLEKGRHYTAEKFAKSNWHFRKWIWRPSLGLKGIMQVSPLKHVTVLSGVGVGGGSLVYGATLPTPGSTFFGSGSWAGLEDWQRVLAPHYQTARRMLGAKQNPQLTSADRVLQDLARDMGREEHFGPSTVGVFFGDGAAPGELVSDPYFDGEGPDRAACMQCGRCMLGCPHNAKNTLDKNYLHLARRLGAEVLPEYDVQEVAPAGSPDGSQGYFVSARSKAGPIPRTRTISAGAVVFSAGVMGTVPLLLKMKAKGQLPRLSARLGSDIRTNNETITSVTTSDPSANYAEGVTIGSILGVDEHSHVEPIVQGPASNGWKLLMLPRATGATFARRIVGLLASLARKPASYLQLLFARNWGKRTFSLLFMQHLDSTLSMNLGRFGLLTTSVQEGEAPSTSIPLSDEVTARVENLVEGTSFSASTEVMLGTPTTAHILGGCVMGRSSADGVIDKHGKVFNYENLYVCDGSMISANPGVNPSLSITAITEWVMSKLVPATSTSESE